MLDIIAAISLAVLSVLVWGTLIEARGGSAATRIKTAAVVAAWFVILVSLGALGVFSATGGSTPPGSSPTSSGWRTWRGRWT